MIRVYVSSVIDAPRRHGLAARPRLQRPAAMASRPSPTARIENNEPSDKVGCIRNFRTQDGGLIREQLLALSDYDYSAATRSSRARWAWTNYVATLKLTPVTDGDRTFAEWSAEFDCDGGARARAVGPDRQRRVPGRRSTRSSAASDKRCAAERSRGLQKVIRSTVIDAPIERVWAVLRDFNSHDQWHASSPPAASRAARRPTRSAACAASA